MNVGSNSNRATQSQSSNSQSSTRPTSPNELADYFWMMDSLTGGYRPQTGGITYNAPQQSRSSPYGELWSYGGQVYDSERSAMDAWRPVNKDSIFSSAPMGDPTRPRPLGGAQESRAQGLVRYISNGGDLASYYSSGAGLPGGGIGGTGAAAGGSWSYNGQSYATREAAEAAQAADQSRARDGRLATWAKEGTREVGYGGIQPYIDAIAYDQLTPEQLRALGGAGATRELQAGRVYGDQMSRIRSDPRLSVFQGQRSGQEAGREYQGNLDAIGQEVEALLTQVAQQERAKSLEAAQSRAGFASEDARRRYDAAVRNANLTREDMALLAQMLQGFKGQFATSTSSSSGNMNSSGSGWEFGLASGWLD